MTQPMLFEDLSCPILRELGSPPFLKWVGGKRQVLNDIMPLTPSFSGVYHEPFLGSGALFFALQPERATLGDCNLRLIRTYRGLRDSPEKLIRLLSTYPYEKDFYLAMRDRDIDSESDVDVAAWMIYLNRTGYNGLYRVNSKNKFNVPFGRHIRPLICDVDRLKRCSKALQPVQLFHDTFESVETRTQAGDFVYFDPPYEPLSPTSNFTSYSSNGFGIEDQTRLRDLASRLKTRGVHVLISNSAAESVYDLYRDGFEIFEVRVLRKINSRGDGRGRITELLIR